MSVRLVAYCPAFAVPTLVLPYVAGKTPLHTQLEKKVAEFVNKPAALCFSMGYLTNEATIPALVGKGGLIVSDAYNHKSIVNGARASGAAIRPFTHNSTPLPPRCLCRSVTVLHVLTRLYSLWLLLCTRPGSLGQGVGQGTQRGPAW